MVNLKNFYTSGITVSGLDRGHKCCAAIPQPWRRHMRERAGEAAYSVKPGYDTVCLDVVPRNEAALRLYHRLGYDSLSLMTFCKQFGENTRDRHVDLFGFDFRY